MATDRFQEFVRSGIVVKHRALQLVRQGLQLHAHFVGPGLLRYRRCARFRRAVSLMGDSRKLYIVKVDQPIHSSWGGPCNILQTNVQKTAKLAVLETDQVTVDDQPKV